MRGGKSGTGDYPAFPDVVDAIGYNPARWLHTTSPSGLDTGIGQTPELATPMSIVKGIDDAEELAYWFQVERRCRDRDHVIRKLEERRRAIKHGRDGFLDQAEAETTAKSEVAADGGVDSEER